MNYLDFVIEATRTYNKPDNPADYRLGQYVYNKLAEVRPDIATKLCGTPLDPYYRNSVPTETWEFIHRNW